MRSRKRRGWSVGFNVCWVVSEMILRVLGCRQIVDDWARRWSGVFHRAMATAVLGLSIVVITGCAKREAAVYQEEVEVQTPAPAMLAAPADGNIHAAPKPAGPIDLKPSSAVQVTHPSNVPETSSSLHAIDVPDPSERLAFLEWFGSAADRARVRYPTDALRMSREVTVQHLPEPGAEAATAPPPFAISNNSRLVPTYGDGLPGLDQAPEPQAASDHERDDITGSFAQQPQTAQAAAAAKQEPATAAVEPQAATASVTATVKTQPAKAGVQLLPVQPRAEATQQAHAAVEPEPADEAPVQIHLPDRTNPFRLHIDREVSGFNQRDRSLLEDLAALHAKTGLNVHIRGVTRGVSGDGRKSVERVRRLHGHANRAIAVLGRHGVPRSRITISTAEQRMTGIDFGTFSTADEDRLELSLE